MVKYTQNTNNDNLDLVFYALSDPIRRDIIDQLTTGSTTVTNIVKNHNISFPAISRHLKVLKKAELIEKTKIGRSYQVRLTIKSLKKAEEFIAFYTKFWNNRFENLDRYLKNKNFRRREVK